MSIISHRLAFFSRFLFLDCSCLAFNRRWNHSCRCFFGFSVFCLFSEKLPATVAYNFGTCTGFPAVFSSRFLLSIAAITGKRRCVCTERLRYARVRLTFGRRGHFLITSQSSLRVVFYKTKTKKQKKHKNRWARAGRKSSR